MRYIQLDWIHNHPDDPVRIYSEIGDDGYELRRIDIYRDGRIVRVSAAVQDDTDFLNPELYPSFEELTGKDEWDETKAQQVAKDVFESVWKA